MSTTTLVILGAKRSKSSGLGVVSLQKVGGSPLILKQINTARASGFRDVVAVGGASYRKMIRACKKTHVFRVREPNNSFAGSMKKPIELLQTSDICFVFGDIYFDEQTARQIVDEPGNCIMSAGQASSSLFVNCDGTNIGYINYGAGTKWAKIFKVKGEDIALLSHFMNERPFMLPHEYINLMIDEGAVFKHLRAVGTCLEINNKKDLEKIK